LPFIEPLPVKQRSTIDLQPRSISQWMFDNQHRGARNEAERKLIGGDD